MQHGACNQHKLWLQKPMGAFSHVIFAAGIFLLTKWGKLQVHVLRHHLRDCSHHRNGFLKCKLNMLKCERIKLLIELNKLLIISKLSSKLKRDKLIQAGVSRKPNKLFKP